MYTVAEMRAKGFRQLYPGNNSWGRPPEHYEEALAMREHGATFRLIGQHFGVGPERARNIVGKAQRRRDWKIKQEIKAARNNQKIEQP